MDENDEIEIEAKQRYLTETKFRVAVDRAVGISIPEKFKKTSPRNLYHALREQAISSASIAIVTYEKLR